MASVSCPECGATVEQSGNVVVGEVLQCPDCGVELEVTGVDPLEVDLAPKVQEDWGE